MIKESSTLANSHSSSVFQSGTFETLKGNDWKSLKPSSIGEGDYVDRVTVVLPCYMGQEELALTFASLSKQTYPHHLLEVVVVDDGSEPPIKLPSKLPFETSIVSPGNPTILFIRAEPSLYPASVRIFGGLKITIVFKFKCLLNF